MTTGLSPAIPLRTQRGLVNAVIAALMLCTAGAVEAQAWPRTAPERTDFRETSRYEEVVAFMHDVAGRSSVIAVDTFGYTYEGRALPVAIVGRLADTSPEGVRASGRTVVYLQGNIHGGEVEGKEVLLTLLRDLAQGEHAQWLDSLVLLVAPIYNADGNERVRIDNRPRQHGPIAGMGQRSNAQGYDLNRDHMKLDTPEARSLVGLFERYDPHVGVDLHTTNGTRHGYHLTYSPPLHPATDSTIVDLLRDRLLPHVTERIRASHDFATYYYGNLYGEDEARGWYTFDHRPRFGNNYLGLRNRFAILSEAYSYATFEDRIAATSAFVREILDFVHAHGTDIRETVRRADATSIVGTAVPVRATFERSAEPVEILMGSVVEERNPFSGDIMLRRTDERRAERMWEFGTFSPTETVVAPAAYAIPAEHDALIALLAAHHVRLDTLTTARDMRAERFVADSSWTADRPFEQHNERTMTGRYVTETVRLDAGTVLVPVGQPLGRLIVILLEPRSDDGALNWNVFDQAIEQAGRPFWPVLRLPAGQ